MRYVLPFSIACRADNLLDNLNQIAEDVSVECTTCLDERNTDLCECRAEWEAEEYLQQTATREAI